MLREKMYNLYCKNEVKTKEELRKLAEEIDLLEDTDDIEKCKELLCDLTLQYFLYNGSGEFEYARTDDEEYFLIVEGWNCIEEVEEITKVSFNDFVKVVLQDEDYWGFSDEYTTCTYCDRLIRTSPTSYNWLPNYHISNGEILCENCCKNNIESVVENGYVNNYEKAITMFEIEELEEIGFKLLDKRYESGYYGIADSPKEIFENLSKEYDEVIFIITSQGQFDTEFKVMVKKYEEDGEEEEEDLDLEF